MIDELAQLYPPFGLSVRAGDITLRVFRDSDLPAYAELVSSPIFADDDAPHVFAWTQGDPAKRLTDSLQFQWAARSSVGPEDWQLPLGVFEGERLVGSQDLSAKHFAKLGVVGSGSYLRLDAQGRGIGTLMRQMVLVLAFDHLGAVRAESSAVVGNAASLAVSRHCGYALDGFEVSLNGERRVELQRVAVTPETFVRPDVEVTVSGVTPELRTLLGAVPAGS
ncbi:GNAT family N-acetyltransferase [Tessaracoccus rhinocerotis]|uniref:GNAT family N-acetyltransferase n=1 Tax=Tessaracoccus rhinocerotis TaxID=1689449 RepID=A0A553K016_9ACTN|nr:GNAT family protein [Tessaracoccus rhinocerotis]TRY18049.1 GNAT family N-acetyltransferase [Tessaracoccus rhinocerotis]